MLMWIATLAPLLLIAPRIVRWKPNWLGGVIACFASVTVSAISGYRLHLKAGVNHIPVVVGFG